MGGRATVGAFSGKVYYEVSGDTPALRRQQDLWQGSACEQRARTTKFCCAAIDQGAAVRAVSRSLCFGLGLWLQQLVSTDSMLSSLKHS